MATTPAKPPASTPPRTTGQSTARAPDQQIPAGQRAPDHPLPAGYTTGYSDKPTRTKEDIRAERERLDQTGESVPLSEVNLDPMNDVSRNPRYNPEIDPPLSVDDALAATAATLQAHHIDTKAYKQQFADENRPDGVIQHIAIPRYRRQISWSQWLSWILRWCLKPLAPRWRLAGRRWRLTRGVAQKSMWLGVRPSNTRMDNPLSGKSHSRAAAVADFSGMMPLRDPILLPDNNGQLADNCWLYRGQVRGFRSALPVFQTQYADTQQIYRIPTNDDNPPDFTSTGSLWLEFPDPYMTTIRNPTVGDTFNRYYFFPSDQYASQGNNPLWPTTSPGPMYNTLANLQSVPQKPGYILGLPTPGANYAPIVTPPPSSITMNASAASVPPSTTLTFASSPATAGVLVGMNVLDLQTTTLTASVNLPSAAGTTTLNFSSTTGILAGMVVTCTTNPAVVFPGTTVASVTPTTVVININLIDAVVGGAGTTPDAFKFVNSNQIISGTTVKTVSPSGSPNTVTLSSGVVAGGVQTGDLIQFLTSVPETRAYGYTYVNDFAEESQISPVTVKSGDGTGTWVIVIPKPPADYATGKAMNPGHYRLYRTVTDSSGNATYFQSPRY